MTDEKDTAPAATPAEAEKPTFTNPGPSTPVSPAKANSDGAAGIQSVAQSRAGGGSQQIPAGDPGNEDGDEPRTVIGDPRAFPTAISDPEGKVSNRVEGTIQSEPKPEDLPPDAKVTPIATQLNPNAAQQSIGAPPQPEVVAGAEQPKEGKKEVTEDMSDATEFLPEGDHSDQHDEAKRATEQAKVNADRLTA